MIRNTKNLREIVITAAVVLALLVLSVLLLKAPQAYFKNADKTFAGVLDTGKFDINNEIKAMSIAQKAEIFRDEFEESSYIINEIEFVWNKESLENFLDKSLRNYLHIFYNDYGHINKIIEKLRAGQYRGSAYNIIKVENNDIYSSNIACMDIDYADYGENYHTEMWYEMLNMQIVFDRETYEILGMQLYTNSESGEAAAYPAYKGKELAMLMEKYYNMPISLEQGTFNMESSYYIIIWPWSRQYNDIMLQKITERMNNKEYMTLESD